MSVLTPELRERADQIVAKYPNSRSAVLPLLFLMQSVEGHLTDEGMQEVADILNLTPAQILAAASFYTMLKKKPQGIYLISVCRNIACTHLGGRELIKALEKQLHVKAGGTTRDGRFSLEAAECLATCDGAPSMQINYEDFYNVTPEIAVELIEKLIAGEEVRSVRGEVVKDSKEISAEIATAGLQLPHGDMGEMRTVGGESPRADTAPGFRPKVPGEEGTTDAGE
jgi:NADH-quinone oxidoreductase subunit E